MQFLTRATCIYETPRLSIILKLELKMVWLWFSKVYIYMYNNNIMHITYIPITYACTYNIQNIHTRWYNYNTTIVNSYIVYQGIRHLLYCNWICSGISISKTLINKMSCVITIHSFWNIIANQEMSMAMSTLNEHHIIPTHTFLRQQSFTSTIYWITVSETIWNIENKVKWPECCDT